MNNLQVPKVPIKLYNKENKELPHIKCMMALLSENNQLKSPRLKKRFN